MSSTGAQSVLGYYYNYVHKSCTTFPYMAEVTTFLCVTIAITLNQGRSNSIDFATFMVQQMFRMGNEKSQGKWPNRSTLVKLGQTFNGSFNGRSRHIKINSRPWVILSVLKIWICIFWQITSAYLVTFLHWPYRFKLILCGIFNSLLL